MKVEGKGAVKAEVPAVVKTEGKAGGKGAAASNAGEKGGKADTATKGPPVKTEGKLPAGAKAEGAGKGATGAKGVGAAKSEAAAKGTGKATTAAKAGGKTTAVRNEPEGEPNAKKSKTVANLKNNDVTRYSHGCEEHTTQRKAKKEIEE